MKKLFIISLLFISQICSSTKNSKDLSLTTIFKQHFVGPFDATVQKAGFVRGFICGSLSGMQQYCLLEEGESLKIKLAKVVGYYVTSRSAVGLAIIDILLRAINDESATIGAHSLGFAAGGIATTLLPEMLYHQIVGSSPPND